MSHDKKTILISGIILMTLHLNAQINVAVIDFTAKGLSKTEASILTDRFRNNLVHTGVFRVYERENVDSILEEQGFQQTGLISDESMAEIGKLIGVDMIIGGSASRIGNLFTATAKMIDVKTGEIVKSAAVDQYGDLEILLSEGMNALTLELIGQPSELKNTQPRGIEQPVRNRYSPIQIAFIYPVQIFPQTVTVTGLRINLIYGKNRSVYGIDAGLLNHVTKDMYGIQAGLINRAGRAAGIQAGLINSAETMFGIQVGLLNSIRNGPFPFLPFVNASFALP